MISLAEVFDRHGKAYIRFHGDKMPADQRRAMRDILWCRTPDAGQRTWLCPSCGTIHHAYHSCNNRSCPQCQNHRARDWLAKKQHRLLPVTYFMATFTLPEELRPLAKAHPKIIYDRLFKSASASLVKLGRDPKYLGGDPGMIGVLQTWDRQKNFHPHIHFILPGVALHPKGKRLCFSKKDFLIRTEPLANIFRAKLKDALLEAGLAASAPPGVWRKKWVVNIKAVGSGLSAFKYLVFYLFGGAISNRSLVSCTDQAVSFRYQDSKTGQSKTLALDPLEFIRRILQHVPPKGFQRVRYYGFLASRSRGAFEKIADLLGHPMPVKVPQVPFVFNCPHCGKSMRLTDETPRMRGPPLEEVLGLISKRKVG